MTAALKLVPPPQAWSLAGTHWLTEDKVELRLECGDEEALITVEIRVDLPRSPSEPAYPEELLVRDVEGAAIDAEREVERHRRVLVDEFWRFHPYKWRW